MRSTKVLLGDKRLKDIYVGATTWQVFKFKMMKAMKWFMVRAFIVGLIYGAFLTGKAVTESKVSFAKEVVQVKDKSVPPVMQRIAGCESLGDRNSKGAHFDKNGKLITKKNADGSIDIGKYQINNKYWSVEAMQMDLNLTKEQDNEEFAMWLYETKGTEPWVHSKPCWK